MKTKTLLATLAVASFAPVAVASPTETVEKVTSSEVASDSMKVTVVTFSGKG